MTWYGLSVFSIAYVLAVAIPGPGFLSIVSVIMVIPPLVLGGYAFGASRARRFFSTPRTVRWVQRGTGVAMASAAVAVATR
jgi:threonine/homoserine/homoserine lactone efflux protein